MNRILPLTIVLLVLGLAGCSDDTAAPAPGGSQAVPTADARPDPGPTLPATEAIAAAPIAPYPNASARIAGTPDEPQAPSAFVVIQNAGSTNPRLLVQQLQQVLPKTQVVKQVQSPDAREIKLEVTNTKDVRALANKIPFAEVESIDDRMRTITVDFDL